MTRVCKAATVGLMTPMVAAAIAVGLSQPAHAAESCPPLGSATIAAPSGTVTVGSTVHVSAQINGLMLLQAHLQISGPGLNQQVGKSEWTGKIEGDVTMSKAGAFTLAVIGNGTGCTYKTEGFSVKARPSPAKSTHAASPSKTPGSGSGGNRTSSGSGSLPTGNVGNGATVGNPGANPLNGASPFSLPSVAPDGSGLNFAYPSPEPQVASPLAQPAARNVSQTTPIKWGQSLAIALVLLIISAHLGMWSRRQRLAAEGARAAAGGKRSGRGKTKARRGRKATAMMAATGVLTKPAADEASPVDEASPAAADSQPINSDESSRALNVADPTGTAAAAASADTETLDLGRAVGTGQAPDEAETADQADGADGQQADSPAADAPTSRRRGSGRGRAYQGRRRRN
ncbi:hypothetical protein OG417_00660 [Actinoallomurus sp. NBC_01490]|uniref:hypothetical protein n=1 Tax=Actinoallomurus sp. NBC_01490 TaxID=2903557 RepID=UPI002E31997F|nr:hypothetical protein [Actinoallomurus sp. NBC_01490]